MLVICHECGKQISDKAKCCPHCGWPATLEGRREATQGTAKQVYLRKQAANHRQPTTTRTCPYCLSRDVLRGAVNCPHCGRDLSEHDKPFWNRRIGCAGPLAALFIAAGFFYWPLWILAAILAILAAIEKRS